ncbi:MAG: amidotransferase [Bacteroidetes bacterium]|nr:amidotransferase [Bacteroidota bacterium]
MKIHYLQHVAFEGLGSIEDWALENKHKLSATKFFEQQQLPKLDSFDMLVILGGPMGVADEEEFPWLAEEKAFIKKAIAADRFVVGICLGAQLIAEALEAKVYPNKVKEIGWFPIQKTGHFFFKSLPDDFTVFHWHGDTFDLPRKAIHLASSAACRNQAFLYNKRVLALQFHLEVTEKSLQEMLENGRNELTEEEYIQSEKQILEGSKNFEINNSTLSNLLNWLR